MSRPAVAELPDVLVTHTSRPAAMTARGAWRLRRFRWGMLLVCLIVALALLGPMVAPRGETEFVGLPNQRGVDGALFGTDYLGQDVWSRFLRGGLPILVMAGSASAIGLLAGTLLGLAGALHRGLVETVALMALAGILLRFLF